MNFGVIAVLICCFLWIKPISTQVAPTVNLCYLPKADCTCCSYFADQCEYTLDGNNMLNYARQKLLNPANFGPAGTVPCAFTLTEVRMADIVTNGKNELTNNNCDAFFVPSFNDIECTAGTTARPCYTQAAPSAPYKNMDNQREGDCDDDDDQLQQIPDEVLFHIKDWSDDSALHFVIVSQTSADQWGYTSPVNMDASDAARNPVNPSDSVDEVAGLLPTGSRLGVDSCIFNGPFGTVTSFQQGGCYKGYFDLTPTHGQLDLLALDASDAAVFYYDQPTGDLIAADIGFWMGNGFGSVTAGATVDGADQNDVLWANAFAAYCNKKVFPEVCGCLESDIDNDGDSVPDCNDLDSDNDGILDTIEDPGTTGANFDGDADQNFLDLDSDNDGIFDIEEGVATGTNIGAFDSEPNNIVDGPYGANGFANSHETAPESGIANAGQGITYPDTDNDGNRDFIDLDTDNDGILDATEGNGDPDGDGVPNYRDLDSDNDGIFDVVEAGFGQHDTNNNGIIEEGTEGTDNDNDGVINHADSNDADILVAVQLLNPDSDGDSVPDFLDIDADNDGIYDIFESGYGDLDANRNGRIDTVTDADFDGLPDVIDNVDATYGGGLIAPNRYGRDVDGDGIQNYLDLDSDNDGILDITEANFQAFDATDAGVQNNGFINTIADADSDGAHDPAEAIYTTTPLPNTDGDLDLIYDFVDIDSDNDGIYDVDEGSASSSNLDPNNDGEIDDTTDQDGDGIMRSVEGAANDAAPPATTRGVAAGANAAPIDTDEDGVPDYRDLDSDNDGVFDIVEGGYSFLDTANTGILDDTTTANTDSDFDGLQNSIDVNDAAFPGGREAGHFGKDVDGDGVPNYRDLDSDNDGIFDVNERGFGATDTNNDGILTIAAGNDVDNDGVLDTIETDTTAFGGVLTTATVPNTDGDGVGVLPVIFDFVDLDSDNDGLYDLVEYGYDATTLDANNDGEINDATDNDGDGIMAAVEPGNDGARGGPVSITTIRDTDGDNVPDHQDLDSDNDGVLDIVEAGYGSLDTADNNGVLDDTADADRDGLMDAIDTNDAGFAGPLINSDYPQDIDSDGVPNYLDLDSDNDGVFDIIEAGFAADDSVNNNGIVDNNADTPDRDGIMNILETAPNAFGGPLKSSLPDTDGDSTPDYIDLDSDNDGIYDIIEFGFDRATVDPTGLGFGTTGVGTDPDGDGIQNVFGDTAGRGGPISITTVKDTDSDGVPDYQDLDSDNDSIFDVVEAGYDSATVDNLNRGYVTTGTTGSDNDGIKDIVEADAAARGRFGGPLSAALDPLDTDSDGVPDYQDLDSDNDGASDLSEKGSFSPEKIDTNVDGMVDVSPTEDVDKDGIRTRIDSNDATLFGSTTPSAPQDTDGDNIPDYRDTDSDNDGILDILEKGGRPVDGPNDVDTNNDGFIDPLPASPDPDRDGIVNSHGVDAAPAAFGFFAIVPRITVLGNSIEIASGDTTPSFDDHTSFGAISQAAGAGDRIVRIFEIRNDGFSDLTVASIGVTVKSPGANTNFQTTSAANFVTNPNVIKPGESAPFEVVFKWDTTSAAGSYVSTVTIASDDAFRTPYTFDIAGTLTTNKPNIVIFGKSQRIGNGDTTPSLLDNTQFGSVVDTQSIVKKFQIYNNGDRDLVITGPLTTNDADFIITQQPNGSPIAPGNYGEFEITYTANGGGADTAIISIPNNDASANPFTFTTAALGIASTDPRIEVEGNSLIIASGDTTPSLFDNTNFGKTRETTSVTKTFVIHNRGAVDLTFGTTPIVQISGVHAAEFVLQGPPPTTNLAAGAQRQFSIRFTPADVGLRLARVSIATNDPATPYVFDILGTGTLTDLPDIEVGGNIGGFVPIFNGDSVPSTSDGTDYGALSVQSSNTFTIRNVGTAALTVNTGKTDGTHAATAAGNEGFFMTTSIVNVNIAAGDTSDFNVQFTPGAAANQQGIRTAIVALTNTDVDETPYLFAIRATTIGPEIQVFGNGNALFNGQTATSIADFTEFGPITTDAGSADHAIRTFQVYNAGVTNLSFGAITSSNANFVIRTGASPVLSDLVPGEYATFEVEFLRNGGGTTSTISIPSNDADENPFTFRVTGSILGADTQDISVLGNEILISNGQLAAQANSLDNTAFGNSLVTGAIVRKQFTIRNTGSAMLTLTGAPVTATGAAPFSITSPPNILTVPASLDRQFEVSFDPTVGAGDYVATITITSDDPDDSPYTFQVTGSSIAAAVAEIDVTGNNVIIVNNDLTPTPDDNTFVGEAAVGQNRVVRFEIINNGGADLTLPAGVRITGTNAGDFTVSTAPTTPVTGGNRTPFEITFAPSATGVLTAMVEIPNNDPNENPYLFRIEGRGVSAGPNIRIEGNGLYIASGDASPIVADGTFFGNMLPTALPVSRQFTIINTGTADLTFGSIVTTRGASASAGVGNEGFYLDLTQTNPASSSTLSAGASATFNIRYEPAIGATGVRQATVVVDTDDPDEDPYLFEVQAYTYFGLPPTLQVFGNSREIANGDTTPSFLDHTNFGTINTVPGSGSTNIKYYQIYNAGDSDLIINSIALVTGTRFSITSTPASPIAAKEYGILEVQATVGGPTGILQDQIRIESNDPDDNPYLFTIQAEKVTGGIPDIAVFGAAVIEIATPNIPNIVDGTHFGQVPVGGTKVETFAVGNAGNQDLLLSNPSPNFVSVTSAGGDFTITRQPLGNRIEPGGGYEVFEVTFTPVAGGIRAASISIPSNDPNENPFVFTVTGSGVTTAVEIDVFGNGLLISDGFAAHVASILDNTDFGDVPIGQSTTRSFTIRNAGTSTLTFTGAKVTFVSGAAGEFTFTLVPNTVASNSEVNMDVTFTPTSAGLKETVINIHNNDANEDPYDFNIKGRGVLASVPEIHVTNNISPYVSITSGDVTPSPVDSTLFQTFIQNPASPSGPVTATFRVSNIGGGNLQFTNPEVEIIGAHALSGGEGFSISAETIGSTLAGGATETFTVSYQNDNNPANIGFRTAIVKINSDDPNESPFVFVVAILVLAPENLQITDPYLNAKWRMYLPHCVQWRHSFAEVHDVVLRLYTQLNVAVPAGIFSFTGSAGTRGGSFCWRPRRILPGRFYIQATTLGPTHNNRIWPISQLFNINVRPMFKCAPGASCDY